MYILIGDCIMGKTLNRMTAKPPVEEIDETDDVSTVVFDDDASKDEIIADAGGNKYVDTATVNVTMVDFDKIIADTSFNVRNQDAYDEKSLAQLDISLKTLGLKKPLDVSKHSDGHLLLLCGYRRYSVMNKQRAAFLKTYQQEGKSKDEIPWQKVPCRVLTNLNEDDERIAMLDHGHAKGLRPSELFKAVKVLVKLRWSERMVYEYLGFPRGKVATHFNACKLPEDVQKEYVRFLVNRKEAGVLPLSKPFIDDLKKALNEDMKDGTFGDEDSKFETEWSKIKNGQKRPAGERNKTLDTVVKDELVTARGHKIFLDYIKGFGSSDSAAIKRMNDARDNIFMALNEVFPITPTKVYSEGIVKDLTLEEVSK